MRIGILAVALVSAAPGCAYWKSRALDLWDVVPTAVQFDAGLAVSARVTPFLQTGLGAYGVDADWADSWGMGLGRWGPAWREGAYHLIIGTMEYQLMEGESWPGGPDGRYRDRYEGSFARRSGNFFFLFPFAGFQHAPPEWAKLPPWYGYLDCEAELFLGLAGVRIGLAPLQLPDFLLGFVGIDFVGDDIDTAEEPPGPTVEGNHP